VLASSEKLATASPFLVVGLDAIDGIVAPGGVASALLAPYRLRGITVYPA
jgi:hypothetical protein